VIDLIPTQGDSDRGADRDRAERKKVRVDTSMEGLATHRQLSGRVRSEAGETQLGANVVIRIAGSVVEERTPDIRTSSKARIRVRGAGYLHQASDYQVGPYSLDPLRVGKADAGATVLCPSVAGGKSEATMRNVELLISNLANAFQLQAAPGEAEGVGPAQGIDKSLIKVIVQGHSLRRGEQTSE